MKRKEPEVVDDLREVVEEMIEKYVVGELNYSKAKTYYPAYREWIWSRGSATIHAYIEEVEPEHRRTKRQFFRAYSRLMKVPENNKTAFYRKLLELNDALLGVKISISLEDDVYCTGERDLVGLDYQELKTIITEVEWWADELDNMLIKEFGD